ncbi:MAG: hypothetical protein JXB29_04505 [Sedimentisphaerales bacterium]|nr:hypothetical protein [Sedimentisphaerales bacterium]
MTRLRFRRRYTMLRLMPGTKLLSIQPLFNLSAGLPMPIALINRNWYYRITKKQLEYLARRVKLLHRLTGKICKEKIESLT